MKKTNKLLGIITLVAVIGIIACPEGKKEETKDPELTGQITITPAGPVTTGIELTATYSGGAEDVSFQWAKDGTNIGATSTTNPCKYTPTEAGSYTVTVSAQGFISKTSAAVTVTDPIVEWQTGNVWLQTKESKYAIVEDEEEEVPVAGDIKSESPTEWIIYRYANNTNFERKSKVTQATVTVTGYTETYIKRNGRIEEKITTGVLTINGTDYPLNGNVKNEYENTGLLVAKSTSIDADTGEERVKDNSLQLISDSNGIKTYSSDEGWAQYEYKIQNGEIIEQKTIMTSSYYTIKYTLPTNEVIRAKLPDFRLETMTGDGSVYDDRKQEVEVVSDTDSVLVIRVKTFSKSNWGVNPQFELYEQSDFTYTKFTFPFNETEE